MNLQEACDAVKADFFAHRWVLLRRKVGQAPAYYSYYDVYDAVNAFMSTHTQEDFTGIVDDIWGRMGVNMPLDVALSRSGWMARQEILHRLLNDDEVVHEYHLRMSFDRRREDARGVVFAR